MISEYVERIARELEFDPSLSRRVCCEVEDHLREAAAAEACGGREAERRAVANFGDPRAIAAQFAVVSLARQARRAGVGAVLAIAAVFVAMKARLAWYGLMECAVVDRFQALSGIVVSVDRYAFWLAGVAGVAGWIYIDSRRIPCAFTDEYRGQFRRFRLLCTAAAVGLIVSVASDAILTSLRIVATEWSVESWVPVLSTAVEIACASVLVANLRGMAKRAAQRFAT